MCDPITFFTGLMAVAGGASSVIAAKGAAAPDVEMPATEAPATKAPGAIVRLGNKESSNKDANSPDEVNPFVYKRVAASTLGGLGTAASTRNAL